MVIFSHNIIFARERGNERGTNDGVREKELSCLPGRGAGDFHWYPLSFSVLRYSADFDPRPGVEGTGWRLWSVNPYLCPIFGVRMHRSNQVLAVTQSLFRPIFFFFQRLKTAWSRKPWLCFMSLSLLTVQIIEKSVSVFCVSLSCWVSWRGFGNKASVRSSSKFNGHGGGPPS